VKPLAALLALLPLLPFGAAAQDLRAAAASFPPSLGNPFTGVNQPSSELWLSMFDGLTLLGWGKDAEPGLAVSWRMTSPTTWVFTLRPDVTFHNGKRFTAADVVKVVEILQAPDGARYLIAGEVQNIAGARARDDTTVEFTTRAPDPILPKRLSVVMMVDPDAWAAAGPDGFARAPVGTGPYRLVTWGTGNRDATLEGFAGSWRAPRDVRRLRYRAIGEHTARLQALASGQVDVVTGLQIEDAAGLKQNGFVVHVQPNPQVKSIALRNVRPDDHPLKDERVRQALNYAIDKTAIATQIMLGAVTPVGQGTPPGIVGHNPAVAPYPYDPARAKRLLADAGYPNGFALSINVVTANATPDAMIYEKMAQDLAAVGVRADVQAITFADYQSKYASGNWGSVDAFSQIWNNAAYQDPIRALEYFSCLKPNPFFCEESVVPALRAVNAELDADRREGLLQDLNARYHTLAPAIWISNAIYVTGTAARVTHFEMRPTGIAFERLRVGK
jgi:peptide/nickel transport system substrate-binding protein